ncbi:hypothetical protein GWK47_013416 [Chionoecetes opilio]|uniref:Uncharacterized protein n=1 Tax=Chionoecetes opilio TaxID=41210 RepID=A0A8J4XVJ8_CHIOP|nr:hypothetical protein GWK47_013416 [Chionoecetes opilio]
MTGYVLPEGSRQPRLGASASRGPPATSGSDNLHHCDALCPWRGGVSTRTSTQVSMTRAGNEPLDSCVLIDALGVLEARVRMETVTLFFYYEDYWVKAVYWRAKTSRELSVRIYSCKGGSVLVWAARPGVGRGRLLMLGVPGAARGHRQLLDSGATQHSTLSIRNFSLT